MLKDNLLDTPSMTIVRNIKIVCRYFQAIKFRYVLREGNMVINWLVQTYPFSETTLDIIDFLMFLVKKLLLKYKLENSHVRISWFKTFICLLLSIKKSLICINKLFVKILFKFNNKNIRINEKFKNNMFFFFFGKKKQIKYPD